MNLLEIQKLCKTYGSGEAAVQALKNVSFSVRKGEYVAIVGESGSGKSTLLNMIGALDTPTSGKVLIDGRDTFAMKEKKLTIFRRRNIGFIFQAFNLIPELTVEQNMIFPLLLDYQKPDQHYLEELLAVLNLRERRSHLPSQLSGGQQQRVAIGRALITRPSLILADEPTGNLDSQNSREVIAGARHNLPVQRGDLERCGRGNSQDLLHRGIPGPGRLMFGYVRPALNRLDQEQKDVYQSAYCGLCHALGRRHGWLARMTLQYDFTFLAIVLAAGEGEDRLCCLRCPIHPCRRPRPCLTCSRLDAAADQSMILTWHKLSDDVDDHSFFAGLPFRFMRRLFHRAYRRAWAALWEGWVE